MTGVNLTDPIYEFLRDDRVFLEDLYEDQHIDPRLPWSFASTRMRDQLAGALRQLADLITSRHDLPIPKDSYARLDVIARDGRSCRGDHPPSRRLPLPGPPQRIRAAR